MRVRTIVNKTPQRVALSRGLRQNQPDAEKLLWSRLRNRQLAGSKFRRQHAIGPYVVDFVDLEARLVIELDGGQHNEGVALKKDTTRTAWLESEGYRVIRFWNNDVFANLEGVLEEIRRALG